MTRFGLTQKALVNHSVAAIACFRPNPATSGRNQGEAASHWPGICRRTAPPRERRGLARLLFFHINDAGLLIVPALFFIQRRNGEVAEWSKALPC